MSLAAFPLLRGRVSNPCVIKRENGLYVHTWKRIRKKIERKKRDTEKSAVCLKALVPIERKVRIYYKLRWEREREVMKEFECMLAEERWVCRGSTSTCAALASSLIAGIHFHRSQKFRPFPRAKKGSEKERPSRDEKGWDILRCFEENFFSLCVCWSISDEFIFPCLLFTPVCYY